MLQLEKEKKEKMCLDARRRLLEERCKRIHNPKCCGVDKAALDCQIKERRERQAEECKREQYLDNLHRNLYIKAAEIEKEMQEKKRQQLREINEFRCTQQAPHTRSTKDIIYAPQKEPYPCSDDPGLSVSATQRFVGEDRNYCERKRAQICQLRAWLDQQILERRANEQERRSVEQHFEQLTCSINKCADDVEKQINEAKHKIENDIRKFNCDLAAEQAKRKCDEKKEMEGYHVMYTNHSGPMLTEDRWIPNALGGCRNVGMDMYKGMTPEEKVKFRNEQLQEINAARERRAQEAETDALWQEGYNTLYRTAYLKEQEECVKRAEAQRKIWEENRIMAEEQRRRRQSDEVCVHHFQPTEEYFCQFESSP